MKFNLKVFEPYAESIRAWLINLSVASIAVGLFNGVVAGIPIGLAFIAAALAVVYIRERYMK